MVRTGRTVVVLGLFGMFAVAACAPERPYRDPQGGTLVLPLVAAAPSGALYELRGGRFLVVDSRGNRTELSTKDTGPQETELSLDLPDGAYNVELVEGWTLYRRDKAGNYRPVEDAKLVSYNPLEVWIGYQQRAKITFRFLAQGDPVVMGSGMDINIEVIEKDDAGVGDASSDSYQGDSGVGDASSDSDPGDSGSDRKSYLDFEDAIRHVPDGGLAEGMSPFRLDGVVFHSGASGEVFNLGKDFGPNPFSSDWLGLWAYTEGAKIEFPSPVSRVSFEAGARTDVASLATFDMIANGRIISQVSLEKGHTVRVDLTIAPPASSIEILFVEGSTGLIGIDNLAYTPAP